MTALENGHLTEARKVQSTSPETIAIQIARENRFPIIFLRQLWDNK